jgi:hypothetical protein
MCARALVRYRGLVDQIKGLNHLDRLYDEIADQLEEAAVEPVVFGGMCLEATLCDLTACLFEDTYAEQTDKLGPMGKYFVVAKYMDRRVPDTTSVTYQQLKALIAARNLLVHYKSVSYLEGDIQKVLEGTTRQHRQHVAGINASFKALVLLSLHFDGNIFEELRIIPSFKKPEYWFNLVPSELHPDVRWCIEKSSEEPAPNGPVVQAARPPLHPR